MAGSQVGGPHAHQYFWKLAYLYLYIHSTSPRLACLSLGDDDFCSFLYADHVRISEEILSRA